jgi:YidC/Oxa1 family membrane protein insertase
MPQQVSSDSTPPSQAHSSPTGLSLLILEPISASTGLPWFHISIAGAHFLPLLLLAFSIKQLHNSAALAQVTTVTAPTAPYRAQEVLDQVRAYKAAGDKLVVQRAALEQRKVYKESGMSMLPMSLMPFMQVPVALGMFFSVKHLCALLEQFHWNDVLFLPGLTAPDQYHVLCRDCNTVYCIYYYLYMKRT